MRSLLLCFAAVLALAPLPHAAQAQAPGPQPPQVAEAFKKYQAGNVKGAIALLEPLKSRQGVHPSALSLLGTLYLEAGRPKDALALLGPLADGDKAGPVILQNAARAALALGQTAKAEVYLERAVAKAPVSPASRDLGLLWGSQGRVADSYRLLRAWSLAHPEDQEARLSAAYGAIELNRPPEAEELLEGLPADNPHVRLLRGRVHVLRGEPEPTIATLQPLLANAPPALDLEVRRYLAEAHVALGQSSEAIALLQGKVAKDPSLAILLSQAHYQSGSPAEAAADLEPFARGLLANPPAAAGQQRLSADLALAYGKALVALSEWTDAIAPLEMAAQLAPQSLQAWQLLGRAQLAAGRREEATRSMEKFREIQSTQKANSVRVNETERDQSDPTGRNIQRAMELAATGRADEALALIRQEVSLVPNDPRPRTAEIAVLLAAKRPQDALTATESAIKADPGNPDFLYLRGAVRMALRQLPAAEQDFRQVLQVKSDHVATMNDLAVLLMTTGRREEARQILKRVLEIKPGDATAAANLKSLE
ncbi:MAG TPA: tetratricopeptide repeat protein [Thermoanaerobaculia bacterium]|jgi:Flp pilus assembly protein TadD|nr:tetratricopeptide repeat protein [Thermoanaerobaculia bacterium]